ncbi:MAG TPA: flagellar M-ring protein FliF C-terminal domain-containing protein [Planctomycetota bacterium]|nr:flagellar M-ring protein FliF C-terminal domain-containing protein [Planctomycetota bacterium]
MNFFTQVAVQVRDLYGRLGFSQKMAFVLLIAVVVGALVMFTNWGARGEYLRVTREPLGSARTAVLAALDAAKVKHREIAGGLEVMSSQYNEAMAILATHGIIPTEEIKIRLADIGKEDKMFRTSEDKRAQRLVVLQDWLGDVISHMENIRAAAVALDAPDAMGLVMAEEKGSAAVQVWLQSGVDRLGNVQVNGIAALVAGVRRTIGKADVSIVDNHGHEYRVPDDDEATGLISGRHEQEMTYERRLAGQVGEMLCYYNPVKVMVRLKINFDRKTEETVDVDPEKVVEVESRKESSSNTSTAGTAGGVETAPGVAAVAGTGGGPSKNETTESKFTKLEIYKKVTHLVQAPGDVEEMSVAVFVPREQVIEQIKSRAGEGAAAPTESDVTLELDRVKKSIVNMLLVTDESKITVQAVTFPKPSVPAAPVAAGFAAEFWPKHGRTTVLAVLSFFALFLLWRMVRKPVEVVAGAGQVYTDEEILSGIEGPSAGALRTERMEQKVESMVRESPGDAANLITRWVQSEG